MFMVCRWTWVAALILALAGALAAQSGRVEAPEAGWLAITLRGSREKPPVWFSHRLHEQKGISCRQCHHEYQGRRNVWQQGQPVKKCQSCHGLTWQENRLDIKNAYHRQCKTCHVKRRQQHQQAGPIHCQDCHRRT